MPDERSEDEITYSACYFTWNDKTPGFKDHLTKYVIQQMSWHDQDDKDSYEVNGKVYTGMDMCSHEEIQEQLDYLRQEYIVKLIEKPPMPYRHSDPRYVQVYELSGKK